MGRFLDVEPGVDHASDPTLTVEAPQLQSSRN